MSKEQPFGVFGPPSDKPCCVCGGRPTRTEPRFGYSVCMYCYDIPPVEISKIRTDLNNKPNKDRDNE